MDIFEVAEVGEAAGHIRRHGGEPPVGDLVELVPVPLRDQVAPRQQISTSGIVRICVDIYPWALGKYVEKLRFEISVEHELHDGEDRLTPRADAQQPHDVLVGESWNSSYRVDMYVL